MFPEKVILVVKGDSEDADTIARMLSEHFRVVGAERLEDALTYASDGVDLVIVELESPNFSGLQMLRSWKERQPATAFLVVTDGSDVGKVVEAMKLGAADCVVKPVDHNKLRAIVTRLLKEPAMETAANASHMNDIDQRSNIDIPPGTSLEDLERAAVEQALAQHQGNRTHAAKTLGISVRTLQRKLKAWGMPLSGVGAAPQSSNPRPDNRFLLPTHSASASFSAHAH